MKRLLLLTLTMGIGLAATAQVNPAMLKTGIAGVQEKLIRSDGNDALPLLAPNPSVQSDAALESTLGATRYDKQTNASMPPRFFLYDNGRMAAAWMQGNNEAGSWSDRGTGYNYYNGSAWGAIPTNRIESVRTGWPCYGPLGVSGELVISHRNATSPLTLCKRTERGTGSWTETSFAAPSGATGLEFPKFVTSGPDRNTIHLLALTGPTQFGGQPYQGLDGALLYSRSQDGGQTWNILNTLLPGMDNQSSLGIGPDDYAWAEPHGDTLVFVVGGHWTETYMMMSTDNGTSWTKTLIVDNPFKLNPENTETPRFACSDGSFSTTIDKQGTVHVVFGRMKAQDTGPNGNPAGRVYTPGTDGLVYWNSHMPAIDTAVLADLDSLDAHGLLMGYVAANPANDSIVGLPRYGMGMSSLGQIVVDEEDNLYLVWSGVTVGNPSPDNYNYRHLWARGSTDHGASWSEMTDLTAGIQYIMQEFVFPALTWKCTPDAIHCLYQTANQPGSGVTDPDIAMHDNSMVYRVIDKREIIPTLGTREREDSPVAVSANYPNPFHGTTTVTVTLSRTSSVSAEIYTLSGQALLVRDFGTATAGRHPFTLDGSALKPGAYLLRILIDGMPHASLITVK